MAKRKEYFLKVDQVWEIPDLIGKKDVVIEQISAALTEIAERNGVLVGGTLSMDEDDRDLEGMDDG